MMRDHRSPSCASRAQIASRAMTTAILDDIGRLVSVESPSRDVAALTASADAVAELITARLGSAPALVESAAGPHVHWSGGGSPKVLLLGHHDTVFPLGTLAARPFDVRDGRATGPGVFDMKSGIALAVHALERAAHAGVSLAGVELLMTCDEEVGSEASRALIEARAAECGAVLVLEPSADGGALKTGRKGCGTFTVTAHGRAAHAGLEPERGANALVELSRRVIEIAQLGRADTGTTVTPTVAEAGTADNVVPATAWLRVDVRVEHDDERLRIEHSMASLGSDDPDVRLEVTGAINRPPMPESASTTLFALARESAASVGQGSIEGVAVGGGSDGNFTAAVGVPTLDGLGAVGGGAHADHEYVDVDALEPRCELLTELVSRLLT